MKRKEGRKEGMGASRLESRAEREGRKAEAEGVIGKLGGDERRGVITTGCPRNKMDRRRRIE